MSDAPLDQVKPGCEPFAAEGSGDNARIGVVLVHGFTGSPDSTVPWAKYLNERGLHGERDPPARSRDDLAGREHQEVRRPAGRRSTTPSRTCASPDRPGVPDGPVLRVRPGPAGGRRAPRRRGRTGRWSNPWVRADGVASWQKHLAPFQRFLPYLTKSLPGVASDIADPAKRGARLRQDPCRPGRRDPQHVLPPAASRSCARSPHRSSWTCRRSTTSWPRTTPS